MEPIAPNLVVDTDFVRPRVVAGNMHHQVSKCPHHVWIIGQIDALGLDRRSRLFRWPVSRREKFVEEPEQWDAYDKFPDTPDVATLSNLHERIIARVRSDVKD